MPIWLWGVLGWLCGEMVGRLVAERRCHRATVRGVLEALGEDGAGGVEICADLGPAVAELRERTERAEGEVQRLAAEAREVERAAAQLVEQRRAEVGADATLDELVAGLRRALCHVCGAARPRSGADGWTWGARGWCCTTCSRGTQG